MTLVYRKWTRDRKFIRTFLDSVMTILQTTHVNMFNLSQCFDFLVVTL